MKIKIGDDVLVRPSALGYKEGTRHYARILEIHGNEIVVRCGTQIFTIGKEDVL